MYLDGVEIYQESTSGNPVQLERESLHINDDSGRIAIVDTLTIDNGAGIPSPILDKNTSTQSSIHCHT
ncbi:MAG: hypothetical protein IPJ13_24025 [Saprospiraceae bacterium]|nr:hypothetical protein [Saprospiraceae bacterium]